MLTPKVPNVDIFGLQLILSHIYSLAFCNLLTISEGSGLHQGGSLDLDFPVALVYELPKQETRERTNYQVTLFILLAPFPKAHAELAGLLVEDYDSSQHLKQCFYS